MDNDNGMELSLTSLAPSEDERRSAPPLVYCAAGTAHWIVEPPPETTSSQRTMIFEGPQAQQQALTYAHEKFGNARFFPHTG
jgi:hypothetical protein